MKVTSCQSCWWPVTRECDSGSGAAMRSFLGASTLLQRINRIAIKRTIGLFCCALTTVCAVPIRDRCALVASSTKCPMEAGSQTVQRLLSIGRSLLLRADLHDIGFIENLLGESLKGDVSYGSYREISMFRHNVLSPQQAQQAASLATDKIVVELLYRSLQPDEYKKGYHASVSVYFIPMHDPWNHQDLDVDGTISSSWLGPCPGEVLVSSLLANSEQIEHFRQGPSSLLEAGPGKRVPLLASFGVNLGKRAGVSARLRLTDAGSESASNAIVKHACTVDLTLAQVTLGSDGEITK